MNAPGPAQDDSSHADQRVQQHRPPPLGITYLGDTLLRAAATLLEALAKHDHSHLNYQWISRIIRGDAGHAGEGFPGEDWEGASTGAMRLRAALVLLEMVPAGDPLEEEIRSRAASLRQHSEYIGQLERPLDRVRRGGVDVTGREALERCVEILEQVEEGSERSETAAALANWIEHKLAPVTEAERRQWQKWVAGHGAKR